MKWINVVDELPKPFEVVWVYWRNREVLLACKTYTEEDQKKYNCELEWGWYSFEDEKTGSASLWMRVEDSLDEPKPPIS